MNCTTCRIQHTAAPCAGLAPLWTYLVVWVKCCDPSVLAKPNFTSLQNCTTHCLSVQVKHNNIQINGTEPKNRSYLKHTCSYYDPSVCAIPNLLANDHNVGIHSMQLYWKTNNILAIQHTILMRNYRIRQNVRGENFCGFCGFSPCIFVNSLHF